jgi:hypothetical protein
VVDGVRLDQRLTIPTATAGPAVQRIYIDGRNIMLPDGTPHFPFGPNSRWELSKDYDPAYVRNTLGATWIRIEFPYWQNGSAGDARDDTATETGGIKPSFLANLDHLYDLYEAQGIYIDLAWHSKCGRDGSDDGAGLGAYCALPDSSAAWPNGRNFYNDPIARAALKTAQAFISARYKNRTNKGTTEPLNEPDPQGYATTDDRDAAVKALYAELMDNMLAQDEQEVFIIGGAPGYNAHNIDRVYFPDRTNIIYTLDWFDQPGDPLAPDPIADRIASLKSRMQRPLAFREAANVPILPQQFGSHYGVDTARQVLQAQLTYLAQNKIPGFQWELRAPTVGPVAGDTTYGWIWNRGDGVDTIRSADETMMTLAASFFASLKQPMSYTSDFDDSPSRPAPSTTPRSRSPRPRRNSTGRRRVGCCPRSRA